MGAGCMQGALIPGNLVTPAFMDSLRWGSISVRNGASCVCGSEFNSRWRVEVNSSGDIFPSINDWIRFCTIVFFDLRFTLVKREFKKFVPLVNASCGVIWDGAADAELLRFAPT